MNRRIGRRLGAVLALLLTLTACGWKPSEITVPGSGVDGPTYPLRIEFADVLNLPPGAKVFADGVRVGELTALDLVDPDPAAATIAGRRGYVVAEVAVRTSVRLPAETTAALRQETPLGDVHIALSVPATAAGSVLEPGATIPLAQTIAALPIEDIFAGLSAFVGSGAVTDIQTIVTTMNGVMPENPADTARLAGLLGADLMDMGENLNSVDTLLNGLAATGDQGLVQNLPMFDVLLTPYGVQHTVDTINAEIGVIFVLTALGPVAPSLTWLAPVVQSLDGTARAVVPMLFGAHPLDTDSPSTMKKLVDLIQNKIIPFAEQGPKVNLAGVSGVPGTGSPEEQTGRILGTLRMIGAVR
ncbi:MlaD family protein [Nocardia sp. NPDC057668]|uniref:MlaD family protein n=1 Tax=Nocardia sp. NPDC057668 TaxID=3346202 RepID=UPI0036707E50